MTRPNQLAVVADESALCAAGLRHMIEECLGIETVVSCSSFRVLADVLGRYRSRVRLAVVQCDLPGMNGMSSLHRLCESWPSLPILVIGDSCDRDTILEILSAGSRGFVLRSGSPDELEQALRAAAAGQVFISPVSAEKWAPPALRHKGSRDSDLTARQKEVLNHLAAGKSNRQIAISLGISEGTVKVHVNAAFRALGVHNRVNAAAALLGRSNPAHL